MKQINLDKLPKMNTKICWSKCVGHSIPFIYNDIQGELNVLEYNPKTRKLLVKYNDRTHFITSTQVARCQIGEAIGAINKDYLYKNNRNKNKYVDTSLLPTITANRNFGKIDWKASVGLKIPFVYGDITGDIEILEYIKDDNHKVLAKYKDTVYPIRPSELTAGNIANLVGYRLKNNKLSKIGYKFEVGESVNKTFVVQKQIRIARKNGAFDEKGYLVKCTKCGEITDVTEANLSQGRGCGVCRVSSTRIVPGVNDMWTTAPWLAELLNNPEDGYKYARNSSTELEFKCPCCSNIKKVKAHAVYCRGFLSCNICGDGFSYPEKFIANVLLQLGLDFIPQLNRSTFKWCENYRYDFYIPSLNTIIEAHGKQHYEESTLTNKTLAEEQLNDFKKQELALNNGISQYVVIDCKESELEYIKNSLLSNNLFVELGVENISWKECEKYAVHSMVKDVCDYWNSATNEITLTDLSNKFKLSKKTLINYLKRGTILGWCSYTPSSKLSSTAFKGSEIICLQNKMIFDSFRKCSLESEDKLGTYINRKHISNSVYSAEATPEGYNFLIKSDFEQIQKLIGEPLNNMKYVADFVQKKYQDKLSKNIS